MYRAQDQTESPDVEATHESSNTTTRICGALTTLVRSHQLIETKLKKHIESTLKTDDYTQPLYNEQAVAELYFKNVLAPTKQALDTLLARLLKRADLKEAGYFFNLRPQQLSPSGVLEHMDKAAEGPTWAPPKKIIWQSPADFVTMLEKCNNWDGVGDAPDYPRLVLCVIEEKKPNVVDPDSFKPGREKRQTKAQKNVAKFLPQVKKYSVDAQCPLVILTDYINTMLLEVVTAGAKQTENGSIISTPDDPVVRFSPLSDPPRLVLFANAIRRLVEAGLVTCASKFILRGPALMSFLFQYQSG
ncbi:hypothetical protein B0H14DRAFT_2580661 [Mycena olivaceomarginata]|nr:hypothetical protein B0H14DRAFT_2580661 [Mycena olivaceomarginata]